MKKIFNSFFYFQFADSFRAFKEQNLKNMYQAKDQMEAKNQEEKEKEEEEKAATIKIEDRLVFVCICEIKPLQYLVY